MEPQLDDVTGDPTTDTHLHSASVPSQDDTSPREDPAITSARERLNLARERLLKAAIAFCDGSISVGQLRAVRELLREQEVRLAQLEGESVPAFIEEPPVISPTPELEVVSAGQIATPPSEGEPRAETDDPDLKEKLSALHRKLTQLDDDIQKGRINPSQYRAIRRHYEEQIEIARKIHQAHPQSDRWRTVLEEGKTTFLMQLNEAECLCIAVYDIKTHGQIILEGHLPANVDEAIGLLRTFDIANDESTERRMLATQTDDGSVLLLIPGKFTAALVSFSQEPPGWQIRAIREVHRNFEAANLHALKREPRGRLILPDLKRFIKKP